MSTAAIALPETSLRRRTEYRKQLVRRLSEMDVALELLRARLQRAGDGAADHDRKLFLALRDRRRNLDAAVEELMLVPEDDWSWQKREVDDARTRLADLLDAALAQCILRA